MKPERIDQLTGPPEPGRFYLVPCVHGRWHGKAAWWPVMGAKHEDTKFFHFPQEHYHLDRRFLAREDHVFQAVGAPLHAQPDKDWHLSEPVWKRRKCHWADFDGFPVYHQSVRGMQDSLAGARCKRSASGGWVCPHRGFDLSSVRPNAAGVLTCPLHGLRIAAASGRVLSREALAGTDPVDKRIIDQAERERRALEASREAALAQLEIVDL